jgi:hypothetical protein
VIAATVGSAQPFEEIRGEDEAVTTTTTTAAGATRARPAGRGPRFAFAGTTEARPGIMTTEFWLTILSAATVVIAGYVSDELSIDLAWALFAGILAAYMLSRGLAKAGSREGPFVLTDRGDGDGGELDTR